MNKKDRSLTNSRDEAKKIYYQRREINKLQQEKQQLKEEISEWKINYTILQNKVIECNEDRIRLNNVLEEIREYINNHSIYFATKEKVGNYFANCSCDKLLQILDKVEDL